mgnify:CR=1 FL=1
MPRTVFAPIGYGTPWKKEIRLSPRPLNTAVADEQYFYHILITPFLFCISSQMLNIAGFFGIFLFLYFRGIFLNLPVFSYAFSCNIGKSVGK